MMELCACGMLAGCQSLRQPASAPEVDDSPAVDLPPGYRPVDDDEKGLWQRSNADESWLENAAVRLARSRP